MAGASGDTLEVSIKHPVVGDRTFACQKDQSNTRDLGGYSSERQFNGNGTGHKKLTAKGWEFVTQLSMVAPGSQQYLQKVQNHPEDATIIWTHISGDIYRGTGSIEGDLKSDTNTGYAGVTFVGNGEAEQIS